jgi:hypothetical protein
LQFVQNTYSWSSERYRSAVVLQYEIVNFSNDTLRDCVVGQVTDPDIGSSADDRAMSYRGRDGKLRSVIVYNDPASGEPRGEWLVQVLLESPPTREDGFMDNSLRGERARSHELGTFRNWGLAAEPKTPAERYDFLRGPVFDVDDSVGDKRTVMAGRPFSMLPGDTAHFTMAFAVVSATSPFVTDNLIENLVNDYANGLYETVGTSSVSATDASADGVALQPNPALESVQVAFTMAGPGDVEISVVNGMGERVAVRKLGSMPKGSHRSVIDVDDLATGSYLVIVSAGAQRFVEHLMVTR